VPVPWHGANWWRPLVWAGFSIKTQKNLKSTLKDNVNKTIYSKFNSFIKQYFKLLIKKYENLIRISPSLEIAYQMSV